MILFYCRVFPIGQWTHVILTWNHEEGPRIYVNGSVAGNFVERNATIYNTNQHLNLQIGSGFEENSTSRGDCIHPLCYNIPV